MTTARRKAKAASFEEGFKRLLGKKYKDVPKELKKVVREMTECQERGAPAGSAPQEMTPGG